MQAPPNRLATGNKGLDMILEGGLPANSINIIMGEPGNGKTILAEQLMFHNAREGFPCVMLTTMSEPLGKVVRYLQGFSFFDLDKINASVRYESLGEGLVRDGVTALLSKLRAVIDDYRPRLIVIDSFKALHDICGSVDQMRRLSHEMAALLTSYEVTTLLIGEYHGEQVAVLPEFAIADAIIQLQRVSHGVRDDRYLRVTKLRGSRYREGLHAFSISDGGVQVFPRLVSPRIPADYQPSTERVGTGVDGLDALLGGGLRKSTTTVIKGSTGSGKTTLAMQFVIAGLRRDESCLYVNFQENPSQLLQMMDLLGCTEAHSRRLSLMHTSPVELSIDRIIVELFDRIKEDGVSRLVVDAAGDLAIASVSAERIHDYLYALSQHFSTRGVTAVIVLEVHEHHLYDSIDVSRLSHMCDNIIELGVSPGVSTRRTLRIVKSRRSASDLNVHPIEIQQDGVHLIGHGPA